MKRLILDILNYLHYQVENDKCTPEELRNIYESVASNMNMDATITDLATHFHQSESNVRNIIARRYKGRPKRRVYYNFVEFIKNIPKSWASNTH